MRFLQALFADSNKTEYQTVSATERQREAADTTQSRRCRSSVCSSVERYGMSLYTRLPLQHINDQKSPAGLKTIVYTV